MNRSVLARQMFARGGAAFPDLSGDGKITQKDILMGRGVPMQEGGDPQMAQLQAQADAMGISVQELIARLQNPDMENYIDEGGELFYDPASGAASRRQMFDEAAAIAAKYQQPVGMAMGGDPAMAQGVGSMMPPPPAMPEGQGMAEQVMDPQVLEGVLSEAQNQITDLDEAEDYETVINSIRGEDAPIEERYEELASIVGEEDARQTPESVLTLVQPAMVMGAVDQGIGGLAQGAMAEPVQGAMAQGIMSTVEPPQPAMEAGGTPPVNFKDGGLVRRGDNQPVQMFSNGGETLADFQRMLGVNVTSPQNLTEASLKAGTIPAYEPTYDERVLAAAKGAEARYAAAGLGTAAERAAELEEQKNLTQAQMLFDVAQTALTFAGPMQGERPGMSAAERLALAASSTKLPQTIGARAQTLAEQKRAADKEERALKLAAVQRGEKQIDTEIAAEQALELAKAKKGRKTVTVKGQVIDVTDTNNPFVVFGTKDSVLRESNGQIVDVSDPKNPTVVFGRETKDTVNIDGQVIDITDVSKPKVIFGDKKRDTKTVNGQIVDYTDPNNVKVIFGTPDVKTVTVKGQVIDITKPESPKVIFGEKDPTIRIVEGQVVDLTDKDDPVVVFGDPKKDTAMVNGQLIDYTDSDNPRVIYGDKDTKTTTINGEVVDITDPDNPRVIFGKPNVKTVTIDGQVVDITDPDNVKTIFGEKKRNIKIVKGQLVEVPEDGGSPVAIFGERTPSTGTFENMILANGKSVLVKKVGSTLYDTNGDIIDLATDTYKDAVIVSKDTAFTASKTAKKQAAAKAQIAALDRAEGDERLSGQLRGQDDLINKRVKELGGSLSPEIQSVSFDALKNARKGVGFYNKIKQALSETGGALVPAFENAFADQVEAGNFIDTVNVLGRVALANSPRYAEGEQTRLADLFPSTDRLLANPENAVRKLVGLKRVMRFEYRQNLNVLANSTDSVLIRQAEQSNYAIQSVLKMLETIPDRGVLGDDSVDATIDALRKARGQ